MNGSPWSNDECFFLRTHTSWSNESLAEHLGRTVDAVKLRRRLMGIRRGETIMTMVKRLKNPFQIIGMK